MAQPDASQAARLTGCGYDGVALRASLPADSFLSGIHLLPAFGTCEEYAQQPSTCEQFGRASLIFCNVSSTQVISTPAVKPFVPLDSNTDYCMDGDAGLTGSVRFGPTIAFWGMAMNTMLFLMFMLRVRRIQVKQTMASNLSEKKVKEHVYTAADFAAMVTGLDRVVHEPRGADGEVGSYRMPELERRLRTISPSSDLKRTPSTTSRLRAAARGDGHPFQNGDVEGSGRSSSSALPSVMRRRPGARRQRRRRRHARAAGPRVRTGLASRQQRASRSSGKPFAPRCVRTRRRRRRHATSSRNWHHPITLRRVMPSLSSSTWPIVTASLRCSIRLLLLWRTAGSPTFASRVCHGSSAIASPAAARPA